VRLLAGLKRISFHGSPLVVGQFDCHPEQAFFARRRIWASRAMCRVLCDTIIARLARFLIKLTHYPPFTNVVLIVDFFFATSSTSVSKV
jgi:hypothetical protein